MYSFWSNSTTKSKKIIALFLVCIFLLQQISFATSDVAANIVYAIEKSIAEDFAISNSFGDIIQKHLTPSAKTIISIQDSHASLSVQNSITNILNNITSKYDIDFIGVEGSHGSLDTSILRSCPDKQIKQETVDQLIAEGLMSSAEAFSITTDKEIEVFGIDDQDAYNENVGIIKELLIDIDTSLDTLKRMSVLISEKIKHEDPERYSSLEVIKTIFLYRNNKIGFSEYWNKISNAFVSEPVYIHSSEVHKILECIELEKNISFKKADVQRKHFIRDILETLNDNEAKAFAYQTLLFKKKEMSEKDYYSYMLDMANKQGVSIDEYPVFKQYYEYLNKYLSVGMLRFQKEIYDLEEAVISRVLKEDKTNNFHLLYTVDQLQGLLTLNIKRSQIRSLRENIDQGAFLKLKRDFTQKELSFSRIEQLRRKVMLGLSFYEIVEKRDALMVKNILKQMEQKQLDVAVVITGGYHAREMMDSMGDNELSYVVVAPNVQEEIQRPYITVLTQKKDGDVLASSQHLAVSQYFATGNLTELMEAFVYPLINLYEQQDQQGVSEFKNIWKRSYRAGCQTRINDEKENVFRVEPELFNIIIDKIDAQRIQEIQQCVGPLRKKRMIRIYQDAIFEYQNTKNNIGLNYGAALDVSEIEHVATGEMIKALTEILNTDFFYSSLDISKKDVQRIVAHALLDSSSGRDVVDISIKLKDGQETCRVHAALYKNGYNLSGKIDGKYARISNRAINAYKNFNFYTYRYSLRKKGLTLSDMQASVEESFRRELKNNVITSISGIDAKEEVYVDKDDEYVVKEITDEQEKGYVRAQKKLGHLVVRFIVVYDLPVNIQEKNGSITTKILKKAVIQKRVHRFFSKVSEEEERSKYKGVLADAIYSGDIETAKMFVNSFFASIKSLLIRDAFVYKDLQNVYGYDASVGSIGPVELSDVLNTSSDECNREKIVMFVENILVLKESLRQWAMTCSGKESGSKLKTENVNEYIQELLTHFDQAFGGLFEIDKEEDVLSLEGKSIEQKAEEVVARQDIGSYIKFRFPLSQRFVVPVCYVGPRSVRSKAEQLLAQILEANNVNIDEIEHVFAELGFSKAVKLHTKMQRIGNVFSDMFYLDLDTDDYVGVKIRRFNEESVTAHQVIMERKFKGFKLDEEEVTAVKKEIAKKLFTLYDYSMNVYKVLAERFDLDPDVNVNDKVLLYREFDKLRSRILSADDRLFIQELLSVNRLEDPSSKLIAFFESLRERRKYPLEIDLESFLVEKSPSGLNVSLFRFGGYVPKILENKIVYHMHDILLMDYDLIFDALLEVWGARSASYFLEKIYYQEPKGSQLKKHAGRYLNMLYENHIGSPITSRLLRKDKAGREDRFYEPRHVFDQGELEDAIAAGRIDKTADTKALDLKQIFYENPNVVVFDPVGSTVKSERATMVKNWTKLVAENSHQANIILADTSNSDNIIIKNGRVFIKEGYVFLLGNYAKITFEQPVEVHYAYGLHLLGSSVRFSDVDVRGPPSEASLNVRYSLESQKPGQIDIAEEIGVPTKERLTSSPVGCMGDDFGYDDEIRDAIKQVVDQGIKKVYVQPIRGTRKQMSGVFSVETKEDQKKLYDFLLRYGRRELFLILRYIPSVELVFNNKRANNDIRAIVTRDSNGEFSVSPIRLYVSQEEKGDISGTGEEGVIMKDVTCMPVDDAMEYCLINGKYFTHEQGQKVIAKLRNKSKQMAKELTKRGYSFDIMAMDFIISNELDEEGIPIVYFIECASHFAGEYDWDQVGEQGSYRKKLLSTAVERAAAYKEKVDIKKTPVIVGIITKDPKVVEKANARDDAQNILFVCLDKQTNQENEEFFNGIVQSSGAYASFVLDLSKAVPQKVKEITDGIVKTIQEGSISKFSDMPDVFSLEKEQLSVKEGVLSMVEQLDVVESFNVSNMKIYEYKFDYLQQRESVDLGNVMASNMDRKSKKTVIMEANNLAELRWIVQEHDKAQKRYGNNYQVSLHLKINDKDVNGTNIQQILEKLAIDHIVSVDNISFHDATIESIVDTIKGRDENISFNDLAIGLSEKEVLANKAICQEFSKQGVIVGGISEGFVFNLYSVLSAMLVIGNDEYIGESLGGLCEIKRDEAGLFIFKFIMPYDIEELQKEIESYQKIIMSA